MAILGALSARIGVPAHVIATWGPAELAFELAAHSAAADAEAERVEAAKAEAAYKEHKRSLGMRV